MVLGSLISRLVSQIASEVERLVQRDDRSIGVVTFNRQQQDLVLNLLEASIDSRVRELLSPDVEDGLFVKNLENVQGDERDVILFSTALSKPTGKDQLPLNFGPLSRSGGEKRLNVAVTRAKRKVVMFSSFDPSDIDLNRTSAVGLAHLRGYMEAAIAGNGSATPSSSRQTNMVETDIAEALRSAGLDVQPAFGMSEFCVDIAVKAPSSPTWQIAVMLDGPRWRSRATVTDRDVMPSLLESMMGWDEVVRVWLPSWINDREGNVQTIADAVAAAEAERIAREAVAERDEPTLEVATADGPEVSHEPAPEPTSLDEVLVPASTVPIVEARPERRQSLRVASAVVADLPPSPVRLLDSGPAEVTPSPYVSVEDTPLGSRDELMMHQSSPLRAKIRSALEETVRVEGPIHLDQLCARLVRRFNYGRARANQTDFVRMLVPRHQIRRGDLGAFVWPDDKDPHTWASFRRPAPDERKRPASEIPPEEIVNALLYCLEDAQLDVEHLTRAMYQQFGMTRITDGLRERAQACIDRAVSDQKVTVMADVYSRTRPGTPDCR
ncbi:AAA domain-containing protein [Gordonia sp. HY285]|uniref:DUF3320 domain-containing protein n=1 Tax=Gordonia liuliyuniae TaxID=2911517 RepID=UPI001F39C4F2|nr:AAA domain-containing protein [Gordonia liuliyuniae]MCF8611691.1 AAA domain-containing protein [Gordonia liuliyuniae]